MKINFSEPYITGDEIANIKQLINSEGRISGDGVYTKLVEQFFKSKYNMDKILLTPSASSALEMAIKLLDFKYDDEIILPSFNYPSAANAVLLANGPKIVFCEVQEKTLNVDPVDIKKRVNKKTKAILPVHYAGVACDMDRILQIARDNDLYVIEDAAQAINAKYKDKYLGTIGDLGVISFHETKNITCGEGGCLIINSGGNSLLNKAMVMREQGTDRNKFEKGLVDRYTWVGMGSSLLLSDILAAFLYAQLKKVDTICQKRLNIWNKYFDKLLVLEQRGFARLPKIPTYASHNGHIFYLIFNEQKWRDRVMRELNNVGIAAYFHFLPLHVSLQGGKLGYKKGDFPVTEKLSDSLLRLPLHAGLTEREVDVITANVLKLCK